MLYDNLIFQRFINFCQLECFDIFYIVAWQISLFNSCLLFLSAGPCLIAAYLIMRSTPDITQNKCQMEYFDEAFLHCGLSDKVPEASHVANTRSIKKDFVGNKSFIQSWSFYSLLILLGNFVVCVRTPSNFEATKVL